MPFVLSSLLLSMSSRTEDSLAFADLVGSREQQTYPRSQSCRSHSSLRYSHSRTFGDQEVPWIQEANGMVHLEPIRRFEAKHCQHVARR